MPNLLGWATQALSAVKDTVVKTIAPEPPPVAVQQTSSKRPITKKGGTKKKKATKKLPVKKDKISSENNVEEENTAAGHDDSVQEDPSSSSTEDDESSSQDEEAVAAEERRKERSRRKAAKAREKARLRKTILANSIVKNLPEDELQAERLETLNTLRQELVDLPTVNEMPFATLQEQLPDLQRALDEIATTIDAKIKDFMRRTPKIDVKNLTIESARQQIQQMEVAANKDDAAILRRVTELRILVSNDNQRNFVTAMNSLKDEVLNRKKDNIRGLEQARRADNRQRAIERLVELYKTLEKTEYLEKMDKDESFVYSQVLDLAPEMQGALFQPRFLVRKLERKFAIVVEQSPKGVRTDGDVSRRQINRTVGLWGAKDDVEEALSFIKEADWSGKLRLTYERRQLGAIIGKAGSGLQSLEAAADVLVAIDDGTSDVLIFGTPEAAEEVKELISKRLTTQRETQPTVALPVDIYVARAIQALHKARVANLEKELDCRITVLINPQDGTSPRILVRAKKEQLDAASARVKADLVDAFVVMTFMGPARTCSRLLVPSGNDASQSRLALYEEFKQSREHFSLFVDRLGSPNQGDEHSGLCVVCHVVDREAVHAQISKLMDRANYINVPIAIERRQLRIFGPKNRELIEGSSRCRVGVHASEQGATLTLSGCQQDIEVGKRVVQEILSREGIVETIQLDEELRADHTASLRSVEAKYHVSIIYDSDKRTASIMGDHAGIEGAKDDLLRMVEEVKEVRAQFETVELEVESSKIPMIIGQKGRTINDIRQTTGIHAINIPRNSAESPTATVTLVGSPVSVTMAQQMIERVLRVSRPHTQNNGHTRDDRTKVSVPKTDDDDNFPTLNSVKPVPMSNLERSTLQKTAL